jgi:hypothetical protein
MSDKCFICLKNTRISHCDTCSIKCHNVCWSNYVKYRSELIVYCPQCNTTARGKPLTRSRTALLRELYILKEIPSTIQNFINKCANTSSSENKRLIVTDLFEYLLKNMFFVRKYTHFEKCVRKKLIEFQTIEEWNYAGEMYQRMFGEQIPL